MKIPNIMEIMHSWKIAAKPTQEQQKIAETRVIICNECEFKVFKEITRNFICSVCKCPISKKVYSPTPKSCPKNKWTI